jgi:MFS family permease
LLGAYAPLFATAPARRLVAAALLARLAVGMFDVSLILLARDATGSYAIAGGALGAHALAVAASAPLRGRVVDRRGSRAVLPPLVVVNAVTIAALPVAGEAGQGSLIVALAVVCGLCVPPIVACMRLEWQRILGHGDPRLGQAYAFEASAQVGVYIVGPLIAGAFIAISGPEAALVVTAAVALVGGLAFALQTTGPTVAPADREPSAGLMRRPGIRTLVVGTAIADIGLGAIDVGVTAFAQLRGHPGAAGVLLAVFAASSVTSAVVYGARTWITPPGMRLALLVAMGAVCTLPLALADSLIVVSLLLVVAGLPSTAQWATSSLALDDVAPRFGGAEAYTWLSTANGVGVAAGGLLAGVAVERSGTPAAFVAAAAAMALGAALIVARRDTLSVATRQR